VAELQPRLDVGRVLHPCRYARPRRLLRLVGEELGILWHDVTKNGSGGASRGGMFGRIGRLLGIATRGAREGSISTGRGRLKAYFESQAAMVAS
jgi:hypothetical protein